MLSAVVHVCVCLLSRSPVPVSRYLRTSLDFDCWSCWCCWCCCSSMNELLLLLLDSIEEHQCHHHHHCHCHHHQTFFQRLKICFSLCSLFFTLRWGHFPLLLLLLFHLKKVLFILKFNVPVSKLNQTHRRIQKNWAAVLEAEADSCRQEYSLQILSLFSLTFSSAFEAGH